MHKDVEKILISEEELHSKVQELAAQITKDYQNKNVLIISVLKGAFVFAADLMRSIELDTSIDFMVVSSYADSHITSQKINVIKDTKKDLSGYDVLIAEDILDSGFTLKHITELLKSRGAESVKICTLLNKPARRRVEIDVDYVGFDVPDEFVVGYGLDFAEKYRNLPYIGILKPCVYEK